MVAPAHDDVAQGAPQGRGWETDITVQVSFYPGIIPPTFSEKFLNEVSCHPLDDGSIGHGKHKKPEPGKFIQCGRNHHCTDTINHAKRAGHQTFIGKYLVLDGSHDGFQHPAGKGVDKKQ